jgi:hypothetical protein
MSVTETIFDVVLSHPITTTLRLPIVCAFAKAVVTVLWSVCGVELDLKERYGSRGYPRFDVSCRVCLRGIGNYDGDGLKNSGLGWDSPRDADVALPCSSSKLAIRRKRQQRMQNMPPE